MTVDLDSFKWWVDFAHKCITSFGVIGLAVWHWILWLKDKEEAVNWIEHHIERRHNMDIAGILALVEHGVPALEAGWAALETQIPQDKADALAAWQAGLKAFGDIKGGIPVILAAIKAAAQAK